MWLKSELIFIGSWWFLSEPLETSAKITLPPHSSTKLSSRFSCESMAGSAMAKSNLKPGE
jgi:hypothetical protein